MTDKAICPTARAVFILLYLQFASLMNKAKANTDQQRNVAVAKLAGQEVARKAEAQRVLKAEREEAERKKRETAVRQRREQEQKDLEERLQRERERKKLEKAKVGHWLWYGMLALMCSNMLNMSTFHSSQKFLRVWLEPL